MGVDCTVLIIYIYLIVQSYIYIYIFDFTMKNIMYRTGFQRFKIKLHAGVDCFIVVYIKALTVLCDVPGRIFRGLR